MTASWRASHLEHPHLEFCPSDKGSPKGTWREKRQQTPPHRKRSFIPPRFSFHSSSSPCCGLTTALLPGDVCVNALSLSNPVCLIFSIRPEYSQPLPPLLPPSAPGLAPHLDHGSRHLTDVPAPAYTTPTPRPPTATRGVLAKQYDRPCHQCPSDRSQSRHVSQEPSPTALGPL